MLSPLLSRRIYLMQNPSARSEFEERLGRLLDIWFMDKYGQYREHKKLSTVGTQQFLQYVYDITFYLHCVDDERAMNIKQEENMVCERCMCKDYVKVHGHTQCAKCGCVTEDCCEGEPLASKGDATSVNSQGKGGDASE
jgi:hypothetical protein|tara:strand:+ start:235 stop:651 length:417 start_codon:yes stop_codon:yes gene_type:complete